MAKKQPAPVKYPKRDPFHAFRLSRLLFKTCAAQTIGKGVGTNAVMLVICVAMQEDAKRYAGPVTFWNSQLLPLLNVTKVHTLIKARDAAVAAGWLHYDGGGKSLAGRYWTIIPERFMGLDDKPCDETDELLMPPNGISSGIDRDDPESQMPLNGINNQGSMPFNGIQGELLMPPNGISSGISMGISSGTRSGIHSTLALNPSPNPKKEDCSETPKGDSKPEAPPVVEKVIMVFPCVGKGPTEWPLTEAKVKEWQRLYPGIDVDACCRKALGWCINNQRKQKTFGGMPAFLNNWLSKDQDRAAGQRPGGFTPAKPDAIGVAQRWVQNKQKERNAHGNPD